MCTVGSPESRTLDARYEAARRGDPVAYFQLQALAAKHLHSLFKTRRAGLPAWEVEDIVCDVLSDTHLRGVDFPSWRAAWAYARKTSVLRVMNAVRERRGHRTVPLEEKDSPASRKEDSRRRVLDIEDEIDAFEARLRGARRAVFRELRLGLPDRGKLCEDIGISPRQLARLVCTLRGELRRFLET